MRRSRTTRSSSTISLTPPPPRPWSPGPTLGGSQDKAVFAALAGANLIPACSGNTTRHRLDRGGDRRLDRAVNVIAMVRMVHHPQTRATPMPHRTVPSRDTFCT
ncbi:transposase [Kocuria arenosa]|uniref:transposase n=1 Tax=Kocuria arenosa TaxID=3071446 RepID=UPI0034D3F34C